MSKLAKGGEMSSNDVAVPLKSLEKFTLKEVLGNNVSRKVVFVLADYENEQGEKVPSVLILERKPFTEAQLSVALSSNGVLARHEMQNDIYGTYHLNLPHDVNDVSTTVILPAATKHIEKFRFRDCVFVHETPEMYENVTLPYVMAYEMKNLKWVQNVLEGQAEQERVVYNDKDPAVGFILSPDMKWDGKDIENLYLLAIVRKSGLRSIRDLTAEHIPLLENVLKSGGEQIQSKYGVSASSLRVYFHYQPSFYHLHVHFVASKYEAPGQQAGKAHLLHEVIGNLQLMADYYQRARLTYQMKEGDALLEKLTSAGFSF